uniref:N-acetyltransferase domain-containing protein n=1 Tax=Globisporangium ultimum (strain ATCC 200006 / CBS 805.95 / DAOM BR144) TaxID=431595 RepID=K3X9S0_GLOUD
MKLAVTRVTSAEEKATAMALRLQVFVNEQGFVPSDEFDEVDDKDTTVHFLGKDVEQDKYVAVARAALDLSARKAKLSRVAVLSECRGKNFGAALMQSVEQSIVDQVDLYVIEALYDKKVFYEKCGYRCINDEIYLQEGVEHCMMTKKAVKL